MLAGAANDKTFTVKYYDVDEAPQLFRQFLTT